MDQIVEEVYEDIISELLQLQQGKAYKRMAFKEVEQGVMKLINGD